MYQVNIKVISTKGENDKNPMVYCITPDQEMKPFAELKDVEIDEIVLLHERDVHFDLIVSKDSDLAKVGSLSFQSNIGPSLDRIDVDKRKKTFAEAVKDKTNEDKDIEIKNLKLEIEKINVKTSSIKKQYDECEKALRKKTEECEILKSELNDLRTIIKLEKELEKTQRPTVHY